MLLSILRNLNGAKSHFLFLILKNAQFHFSHAQLNVRALISRGVVWKAFHLASFAQPLNQELLCTVAF